MVEKVDLTAEHHLTHVMSHGDLTGSLGARLATSTKWQVCSSLSPPVKGRDGTPSGCEDSQENKSSYSPVCGVQ